MLKNDDTTTIRVELPLPLDVASNLMNVLGTIYPNARVRPFDGSHMTIEVDLADRVPDNDVESYMEQFDPELLEPGVGASHITEAGIAPPEWLAHIATTMMEAALEGAPNYIEAPFTMKSGSGMLLTVARSTEQTPHALLQEAKKRNEDLERELESLYAQLEKP